ncbi:hypothetical protein GCM10010413_03510 [Promicromonospora sukumoe]
MVEDRHEAGALDGAEAVRDEHAGAPAEQPVGRGDDARLRERVHPRGRLVEHDQLHVPHEQAREGDELLLPRRQRGAAGAEERVEAVGQAGRPVGQAELADRGLDVGARHVGEQRDVLRERAGDDLRALGDHAHGAAQLLQVQVAHVGAAEEHRTALRLDGARQQRGQRRLARAGAAHEGDGLAGGDQQVHAAQGEGALVVGEGQVPQLEVQRSLGEVVAALGLGLDLQHLPDAQHRAEALLDVRQVVHQVVHLSHEHRGDQEQRDELLHRQAAPGGHDRTGDRGAGEQRVHHQAGPPEQALLDAHHRAELLVHDRGELGDAAHGERLAEAGAQVVPCGDRLLEGGGVIGPGGFLDHLAARDLAEQRPGEQGDDAAQHREQQPGRPPGDAGDDPHGHDADDGAAGAPELAAHEGPDGVGVVVDPVEHLADGLLGERGERLPERRAEQVAAELALGAVDDARPGHLADAVEDGPADDAHGEQRQTDDGRVVGQPACRDGAQRQTDGARGEREQGDDGGRTAQPAPVEPACRVGRLHGRRTRRRLRNGRGLGGPGCVDHRFPRLRPDTDSPRLFFHRSDQGHSTRVRPSGHPGDLRV